MLTCELSLFFFPRILCKDGATPFNLAAIGSACHALLKKHTVILEALKTDPAILIACAVAHCASFFASNESLSPLPLQAYHFDPSFFWASHAARVAVFKWARNAHVVQLAAMTPSFSDLPDDCAGDVLEHLEMAMPRAESLKVATCCISPEARAWMRTVIAAAIAVSRPVFHKLFRCYLHLASFSCTQAKATDELGPAAERGDLASVQDCVTKGANVDAQTSNGLTALLAASRGEHAAIVKLLLVHGAAKEAKDNVSHFAMHIFVR